MEADLRSQAGSRPAEMAAESLSAPEDLKELPNLLRQLSKQGPARDRKMYLEMLSDTEPLMEYLERQEAIQAASAVLEAHWPEYEKLTADKARFLELGRALFAEECFAPLRFTAAEVQRAFDRVGYPGAVAPDEAAAKILRAAILHLADNPRRSALSMRLLVRLPEFVAAGRYPEAWLIQAMAYDTVSEDNESNVFLFQMFAHGYSAWVAEREAKDEKLFRKMGLDSKRLREMNMDDLDAFVASQTADPAKAGMLEEFLSEHPDLRKESEANLMAMERNCANLLEREDSQSLLLPDEEVQPWIEILNERLSQAWEYSEPPDTAEAPARVPKLFKELLLPMVREMAAAIFNRDRIRQLVAELRKYRGDLFAAGAKAEAGLAMGAINYLEREDSPGLNSFLLALCWRSLTSLADRTPPETAEGADGPESTG